jgi:hypothetical protein
VDFHANGALLWGRRITVLVSAAVESGLRRGMIATAVIAPVLIVIGATVIR